MLFGISAFPMVPMIADEIKISASGNVYSPREDSHLLAGAVERYAFGRVLDMGTGSGIQGIVAAKLGCDVTFADISKDAVRQARANASANGVQGRFIETDLFSSISSRFNTIIFNPPYLHSAPTKNGIVDRSLDGGIKGRELIDRFLSRFREHVEDDHIVLLLESSLNDYQQDVKRLNANIAGSERLFFEELAVLAFR